MLSVKQGGIKYHFLSLWYDSTWDWTPVSRIIGEKIHNKVPWKKLQLPTKYGQNPNKGERIQNKKQKNKNVGKPVKPTKNSLL